MAVWGAGSAGKLYSHDSSQKSGNQEGIFICTKLGTPKSFTTRPALSMFAKLLPGIQVLSVVLPFVT